MPSRDLSIRSFARLTYAAVLIVACDRRGSPAAFGAELAPAVRAALDSFPTLGIDREPLERRPRFDAATPLKSH